MNGLLRSFADAVNETIASDHVASQLAVRLSPCLIGVHVQGLGLMVAALLQDGVIELFEQSELVASGEGWSMDIDIAGPPLSLLRVAMAPDSSQVTGDQSVRIRGDAHKLQALRQLLAHLEFDWEERITKRVGDVPARQIGNAVRDLQTWGRQSKANLLEDLKDYLVDETGHVVTTEEIREFGREVDMIRDDVERAYARIQRLERLSPPS